MKIGIIVSFFDFRADVRALIGELKDAGHQLVLFYRESEKKDINSNRIEGIDYRLIREEKRNWRNRLLEYAFLIGKKLPASRHNYFLMELFKISNNPSAKSVFVQRIILFLQRLGLNFVSYDYLIENLDFSGQTEIDDIDQFLGFTEFQSDHFAARLLKEKRPLSIYVYSWDHPFKHTRFSRHFRYKVWSQGLAEDLISLQNVPASNIRICGSSQFSYLHSFLESESPGEKIFDFPYLYYCCAIGIIGLIPQETAIIHSVASELARCRPGWKLVIRPYPLLKNWDLYAPAMQLENVVVDDGFRTQPFPDFTEASFDKFRKLQQAELVLHSGSTIGLEACFLEAAALLVDFGYGNQKSGLSVYGFIHQSQNEKYLLNEGLGMNRPEELETILNNLHAVRQKNRNAASGFELKSLREVALCLPVWDEPS